MGKKFIVPALKIGVSGAIVFYLIWDASHKKAGGVDVFDNLVHQPKHWSLLIAGCLVFAAGITMTFVRWWFLVRALEVPCRLPDAIRIGFWGFLFNLAPFGVVGGDLVKALMLSREHRQQQPRVIASVLVDRVIGLYILFLFATVAILVTGFRDYRPFAVLKVDSRQICDAVFLITGIATAGITFLLAFNAASHHLIKLIARIPRIGPPLAHLLEAVRLYRHRLPTLLLASLITAVVHACSSVACFLIASGLPGQSPPLAMHFVVIPLCISCGVIPLPMGPFEAVLESFYVHLPLSYVIAPGQGLLVALVYRFDCILVAGAGVLCYLGRRRELVESIHAAEGEEVSPQEAVDRAS